MVTEILNVAYLISLILFSFISKEKLGFKVPLDIFDRIELSMMYKLNNTIDTIICDIEGTTTSISFVKEILFPYARQALGDYLTKNINEPECQDVIALLRDQVIEDNEVYGEDTVPQILKANEPISDLISSVKSNVYWQMDCDRKAKPLKTLQGYIWKFAYESGRVKGHVYDDVVPAFERWLESRKKIYIYSSGSIQAQKMLFAHSEKGNLLKYFSGHFDTTIGNKTDVSSYVDILKSIGKEPNQVLFLTDLLREAVPASEAKLNVCVLRRSDNPDKESGTFESVTNFEEIQ